MTVPEVERVELSRLAGRMLSSLVYLENVRSVRVLDGTITPEFRQMMNDLAAARHRIIEIGRELSEGPLEAFAREHPLFNDDLDGPYCGYGVKDGGRPYSCPVHDPARHWDAWELMGTSRQRPDHAKRKAGTDHESR